MTHQNKAHTKRALTLLLSLLLCSFMVACDDDDDKNTTPEAGVMGGEPEGGMGGAPEGGMGGAPEGGMGGAPEGGMGGVPEGGMGGVPEGGMGGVPEGGNTEVPKSIIETAQEAGSFNTLIAAVEAAGLVDTLNGEGPFTVFAPTDDAFAALPEGTVDALVAGAGMGDMILAMILQSHVVSGAVMSSELSDGQVVPTLNGDITVNIGEGGVSLSFGGMTANVVMTDIEASNGVIHVIDAVLVEQAEAPKSIIETAQEAGSFNTLIAAVEAAGLVDTLNGEGPFTVFAPTDDAFAALPEGTVDALVAGAGMGDMTLAMILQSHVVSGAVMSSELSDGQVVPTLNGDITVNIGEGVSLSFGGMTANVVMTDIEASNGVIHVIDAVLVEQ